MHETLSQYCVRCGTEALLEQWHPEKNGELTPDDVTYGSQKKVWWRCDRGHEWQSSPYIRVGRSSGCPYCAGRKVAPGKDLQILYPDIARQWHPTKNGIMTPDQVSPGSHRPVWWQCAHGHEWKALVKSRVEGSGCPICTNRVVIPGINDLCTTAPELAKQWHPEKNGDLTPEQVLSGSTRKVWWRCARGHEWQANIHSRVAGRGCPVCTGKTIIPGENDLESYYPELARQWIRERNGALTPDGVSIYSNKRVWWRCKMGHEWQSAVSVRTTRRSGCPYCSNRQVLVGFNDLKTVEPMVAAQWHPTLNAPLEPEQVTPGSSKRVWWRCAEGHEWRAVIYSRTGAQKCGCPYCGGRSVRKR